MKAQSIRRAGPQDAAVLADLGASTFLEAFGQANEPRNIERYIADTFSETRTRAALADECCHYWIASDPSGDPIGYTKLRTGSRPECLQGTEPVEIQRIYVTRAAIGTGLGAALMRTALAWASRSGHDSIWLGVWEENTHAIEFYERWEFEAVGHQVFRLGEDDQRDLIMERDLSTGTLPTASP